MKTMAIAFVVGCSVACGGSAAAGGPAASAPNTPQAGSKRALFSARRPERIRESKPGRLLASAPGRR